jgi:transcriptional regulator with XRE-family HTH domain
MAERQASDDRRLMEGFGERLRSLRAAYGEKYGAKHHTKAKWARRLWVSPAMYGRWESGANLPQFFDLIRISLLFQVDPNFLIEGVLSDYMPVWLYLALKAGPQELLAEADYWRRQGELFAQANQALASEDRMGNEEPT